MGRTSLSLRVDVGALPSGVRFVDDKAFVVAQVLPVTETQTKFQIWFATQKSRSGVEGLYSAPTFPFLSARNPGQ